MLEVQEIKSIARKVVKATSKILQDVEVVIVDGHGQYMAIDDTYILRKGSREWKPYIDEIIRREEPVIIDNPGFCELCKGCKNEGKCPQKLEITVPFNVDQKFTGYMSIITFSEVMRQKYLEKKDQIIDYLNIMVDLIVSAGQEHITKQLSDEMLQELRIIMQSMNYCVVTCDNKGFIKYVNDEFSKFIGMQGSMKNVLITELLESKVISKIIKEGKEIEEQETAIIFNNKLHRMLINARIIRNKDKKITGYIFFIRDVEDVRKLLYSQSIDHADNTLNLIVGESKEIKKLKENIINFSASESTILIRGETGSGKELVSRSIHSLSPRKDKSFVTINCAAIPDNLLESELFGYEDGAFTGARKGGKAGLFEIGNHGTIFLDEIGDMPLHLQAKLLRVLQEKEITRIGGYRSIELDIRVIAATHQNLEELVKRKEFRMDLYFRLNVIPINVPPLRERISDLNELIYYFIDKYNNKLNKKIRGVEPVFYEILKRYPWPGNVRELENAIEYAINCEMSEYLSTRALIPRIAEYNNTYSAGARTLKKQLQEHEVKIIKETLEQYKHEKKQVLKTAQVLGISRASLYQKIKELNIEI